jgi:hypothetical protein
LSQLDQPELRLSRRAEKKDVAVDLVMRQPSFSKAIALCVQLSGLAEKEVYMALEVDAGHWSRIMKGDGHFPVDKMNSLMEMCGNQAPLIWLAHSNGFGLVLLKSELERQLEQMTMALQKERDRSQLLAEVLQGRAAN